MIGGRGPVHMVRGTTMPAAVYRGEHTISVVDVPMPQMGPSQVLLQVSHCGVCGTDLHLMMEDWGAPRRHRWPRVLWRGGGRREFGPGLGPRGSFRDANRARWSTGPRPNLAA